MSDYYKAFNRIKHAFMIESILDSINRQSIQILAYH